MIETELFYQVKDTWQITKYSMEILYMNSKSQSLIIVDKLLTRIVASLVSIIINSGYSGMWAF